METRESTSRKSPSRLQRYVSKWTFTYHLVGKLREYCTILNLMILVDGFKRRKLDFPLENSTANAFRDQMILFSLFLWEESQSLSSSVSFLLVVSHSLCRARASGREQIRTRRKMTDIRLPRLKSRMSRLDLFRLMVPGTLLKMTTMHRTRFSSPFSITSPHQ
jgi:hypothetical protein